MSSRVDLESGAQCVDQVAVTSAVLTATDVLGFHPRMSSWVVAEDQSRAQKITFCLLVSKEEK